MRTPPVCRPTRTTSVEPVVALDDLVGHPPDRPLHVVGVHDLGPGNENAPVRGRGASFAFGQRPLPSCPCGPHRTRFTVRARTIAPDRRADRDRTPGWRRRSRAMTDAEPELRRRPADARGAAAVDGDAAAAGAPAAVHHPISAVPRRRGRTTTARPRPPPPRRARPPGRGSATARRRPSSPAIQRSAAARSRASGHARPPLDLRIAPTPPPSAGRVGPARHGPQTQQVHGRTAAAGPGGGSPGADLGGDPGEQAVDEAAGVVGGEALGQLDGLVEHDGGGDVGPGDSSEVAMRSTARSRAGMRASVQPLASAASRPSMRSWCSSTARTSAAAKASGATGRLGEHLGAGAALGLGLVEQARGRARARRAARSASDITRG